MGMGQSVCASVRVRVYRRLWGYPSPLSDSISLIGLSHKHTWHATLRGHRSRWQLLSPHAAMWVSSLSHTLWRMARKRLSLILPSSPAESIMVLPKHQGQDWACRRLTVTAARLLYFLVRSLFKGRAQRLCKSHSINTWFCSGEVVLVFVLAWQSLRDCFLWSWKQEWQRFQQTWARSQDQTGMFLRTFVLYLFSQLFYEVLPLVQHVLVTEYIMIVGAFFTYKTLPLF